MSFLRACAVRLRNMFRKQNMERDFSEELNSHLEMHIADNLRAGMSSEEARRAALITLGGVEQTKENYRDRWGLPWLDTLAQDFSFGARILRKNYGFTLIAVAALALGIGFSSVVFSIF